MNYPLRALALSAGACALTTIAVFGHAAPTWAQAAPQATVAPQPTVVTTPTYVLSPGDQLGINVLGHPEVSQEVTILPDGTFHYPIIGNVHAAGMTVTKLTNTLTAGLGTDLNQPEVTVTVIETRPLVCSVLGAVRSPGLYPVLTTSHIENILAACGGPAQEPDLTTATFVTDHGAHSESIDVPGIMKGTDPADNLPVQPGDVLLVQAKDPSAGEVQVIGEVLKPGSYDAPVDGITIATILAETGGAAADAALSEAQITHDGHTSDVDLHPLMTNLSDPVGQTLLMPGDILLVPQNIETVSVLGEVRTPGRYAIPDGRPLTVIDALSDANGPTTDGERQDTVILRKAPDGGDPIVIPVDVDKLLQGKSTKEAMALKPGDILYIPTRHHSSGFNPLNVLSYAPDLFYLLKY